MVNQDGIRGQTSDSANRIAHPRALTQGFIDTDDTAAPTVFANFRQTEKRFSPARFVETFAHLPAAARADALSPTVSDIDGQLRH